MDDDKAVTATFDTDKEHSVRIDLPEIKHYSSILGAYTSAAIGDTIKAWGTDFTEDFTFKLIKAVTIKGGFNAEYSSNTGYTTLQGKLTVQSGSLTVERLVIR
jgi:hypothetical protein